MSGAGGVKGMPVCLAGLTLWRGATENCRWNEEARRSEMDETLDLSGRAEGPWSRGGFLPNAFALNMSMQRHPNTHTETHKHWHFCSHTRDPRINSQATCLRQGDTGNFRRAACTCLPNLQVCAGGFCFFGFVCLLYLFCQSQLMLLYKTNFDRINVFWWEEWVAGVHPNNECTWWDVGRFCISEQKK